MQLTNKSTRNKRFKKIAPKLAVASCALVAGSALLVPDNAIASENGTPDTWDFEVATLLYSESDDRVQAVEPVFSATRNFDDGEKLNIKLTFDTLTGASPNGATPSDQVQTFTRPSGNDTYDVATNESPLDDTFRDTRGSLAVNWSAPINREWEYSTGGYFSKEYDYLSLGLNGGLTRYFNQKNTTLNMGLSFANDMIDPEGGIPVSLVEMAHRSSPGFDSEFAASRSGDDSKTVVDVLVGVTQVIDKDSLFQVNYGASTSSGYLSDPFKILSVIDDNAAGSNYGGNVTDANGNNIYLYEARPDSRLKHTLFFQYKRYVNDGDVLDASYRFLMDDWGINSHTLDFKYRFAFGSSYLEPHLRYYMQSEADFYKRFVDASEYNSGTPTFTEASADERLSEMTAATVGLKYGHALANGNEFSIRGEYYMQTHDGENGYGALASQDLYPDSDAMMLQFTYSF